MASSTRQSAFDFRPQRAAKIAARRGGGIFTRSCNLVNDAPWRQLRPAPRNAGCEARHVQCPPASARAAAPSTGSRSCWQGSRLLLCVRLLALQRQRHRPVLRRGAVLGVEPGAGVRVLLQAAAHRLDHRRGDEACGPERSLRAAALAAHAHGDGARRLLRSAAASMTHASARFGALAFATLPGVSLSAGLISTDVPLLLCWALALVGFAALFETRRAVAGAAARRRLRRRAQRQVRDGVVRAVRGGLSRRDAGSARGCCADGGCTLALALGLALIAPNLAWNYANSFATFSHTADNAKWGGSLLHPGKALEFFGAQFGVFGPILFGAFLVIVWRARRERLPRAGPPAAGVLAADPRSSSRCRRSCRARTPTGRRRPMWRRPCWSSPPWSATAPGAGSKASFVVHIAIVLALIGFGTATAGQVPLPLEPDPFARTLGWQDVGDATRAELAAAPPRPAALRRRHHRRPRGDGRAALLHAR